MKCFNSKQFPFFFNLKSAAVVAFEVHTLGTETPVCDEPPRLSEQMQQNASGSDVRSTSLPTSSLEKLLAPPQTLTV